MAHHKNCILSFTITDGSIAIFDVNLAKTVDGLYLFKILSTCGGTFSNLTFLLLRRSYFSCSDEETKYLHIDIHSNELPALISEIKCFKFEKFSKIPFSYIFGEKSNTEPTVKLFIKNGNKHKYLHIHISVYCELIAENKVIDCGKILCLIL